MAAKHADGGREKADQDAAAGDDPCGDTPSPRNDAPVEGDHGRQRDVLDAPGEAAQVVLVLLRGGVLPDLGADGAQKVRKRIKAEKAEQQRIDRADEQLGKQRIGVVQALVDGAADKGAHNGTDQEERRQAHGNVAELLVDGGAHDGLGENMEEIRADGQDALDAHGHERGRDDEAAARADTTGDQPRGDADADGRQKDGNGIESRRIGRVTAKYFMLGIRFSKTT